MEYPIIGAIVVLVLAITEGIKRAGVSTRYIPLVAIVLAIVGVYIFDGINFLTTVSGVILGLSSTGLYRTVQKLKG